MSVATNMEKEYKIRFEVTSEDGYVCTRGWAILSKDSDEGAEMEFWKVMRNWKPVAERIEADNVQNNENNA